MVLVGVFDHLAVGIVAGRDVVHVDVERHHDAVDRHDIEVRQAGFLAGLAEGDFFDLPLAVGVAAQLQPAVELAVVREQRTAAIGGENPGGGRDVAGPARAVEAIRHATRRADKCDRPPRLRRGRRRGSGPAFEAAAGGAWEKVSGAGVSVSVVDSCIIGWEMRRVFEQLTSTDSTLTLITYFLRQHDFLRRAGRRG